MNRISRSWWWLTGIAALLYVAISLVNHWCFRTYALDLGAYTAAVYDYAHFKFHDSTSFRPVAENLLADHFDLYLMLFSPLSWIFGTYTLLLVQVVAVLWGGRGIYRLLLQYGERTAFLGTVYFYFFFGIVAAVSFDYHSNVVAGCLIPWLFISIREQNLKKFFLLFFLILISRENLSLLLTVLLPCTLAVQKRWAPAFRKWIWITAAFSLIYFVVISSVVMPALSNTGKMYQFRYAVLGNNYGDALKNLVTHPVDMFATLFSNHSGNPEFDGIKTELWIYLLLAGGILFFFNWPFLLMLLPILAQKLFHNQPEIWGINDHYSAELAPIMTIGVFYTVQKRGWLKKISPVMMYVLAGLSLGLTVHMMDSARSLVRRDNIRVYKSMHYRPVIDPGIFKEVKALIPDDAAVSCQSLLHPHFAWRDKIYEFPIVKDAQYIVLFEESDFYPLKKEAYMSKLDSIQRDDHWEQVFDKKGLRVFSLK
jgi:uncharacterized membrane protein